MLDSRQRHILDLVRSSSFTTISQLVKDLGVTDRTIRSDMRALNVAIEAEGAQINLKRGVGYWLCVSDPKRFDAFLATTFGDAPDLSATDKRFRLLLKILLESDGPLSLSNLSGLIAVEVGTLQAYLRRAKDLFAPYDIECVSVRGAKVLVKGSEKHKRDCLANEVIDREPLSYAAGFTAGEKLLFQGVNLDDVARIVEHAIGASSVTLSDYGAKNLMVHCAIVASRLKEGHHVVDNMPPREYPSAVRTLATCISEQLHSNFGVSVSQSELAWLCQHVAANAKMPNGHMDFAWLSEKVDAFIRAIWEDYGYDLRNDDVLHRSLLSHLDSVFQAMGMGASTRNPLLNTIKTSFPLQYEISLMTTRKVFVEPPFILDDDNVGYIALHVGAAIERSATGGVMRPRALAICSFGAAAGEALHVRLNTLFKDSLEFVGCVSLRDYLNRSRELLSEISLIVSTVALPECPLPNVNVSFELTPHDIRAVQRLAESLQPNKLAMVRRFFSPEFFVACDQAVEKDALIEAMCAKMVDAGIADGEVAASVIERENISDTSLSELFAIPHAMRPNARKTIVSVAILKQPLAWSALHASVRVVFLLIVGKDDYKEMEQLYDLLVRIAEDRQLQQRLARATSFEGLLGILGEGL